MHILCFHMTVSLGAILLDFKVYFSCYSEVLSSSWENFLIGKLLVSVSHTRVLIFYYICFWL